MSTHDPLKVHAAFETLLEEIEDEIDVINRSGAHAFEERDYERARAALDSVAQLMAFRDKVVALRGEWSSLTGKSSGAAATVDVGGFASLLSERDLGADDIFDIPELTQADGAEAASTAARPSHSRLQRGLRTPESAYYHPILKALDELGGRAKMNDVLERVEVQMRDRLSDVDYQPLNSDPEQPRWRNAAQWARNGMVKEGLLKDDSPRGVWEISEGGRLILAGR